jgi:hypothetical protein
MPTYLLGFHLNPLTNPWIDKLTQTHILIEQKPTGFRVASTHCHLYLYVILMFLFVRNAILWFKYSYILTRVYSKYVANRRNINPVKKTRKDTSLQ